MSRHTRIVTLYVCGSFRQRGSTLIVALVFLLAMTLIGVTAMQGTTQQESMAGNLRQRNLAFQAAEAALRNGESLLTQAVLPTFNNTGANLGLRQSVTPTADIGTFWLDTYCWVVKTGCAAAECSTHVGALAVLQQHEHDDRHGGDQVEHDDQRLHELPFNLGRRPLGRSPRNLPPRARRRR